MQTCSDGLERVTHHAGHSLAYRKAKGFHTCGTHPRRNELQHSQLTEKTQPALSLLYHRVCGLRRYWNCSHAQEEPDPKLRDCSGKNSLLYGISYYVIKMFLATTPAAKCISVLGSVPFYLVLSLLWACVVVKGFPLPKEDPHSSDIDPLS